MKQSVPELVQHFADLWWESPPTVPDLGDCYSPSEQAENEKQLEQFMKQVNVEVARRPNGRDEFSAMQQRLEGGFRQLAVETLGVSPRELDLLPSDDFSAAAQDFIRQARAYDPKLSSDDVYQAGRNAWTANGLQWLLGLPVACSPSIFAYSMLYPYTDNYLDDEGISTADKLAFNERFRQRLAGEPVAPVNAHEAIIFDLIGMIEGQYARRQFPDVFESLLDIHAGQTRSMRLMQPRLAPSESDILRVSIEKGGTSVLADGYLARGTLLPAQRLFCFGHGVFAQLLDDLEDAQADLEARRVTLFSRAAESGPLDALTNRTFHFGSRVLDNLALLGLDDAVKRLIRRGAWAILIDTASQVGPFYSPAYLRELEAHSPFRFAFLQKQRTEFQRRHGSMVKMLEWFAPSDLLAEQIF